MNPDLYPYVVCDWKPAYNPFAKHTAPKRSTVLKARAQRKKMKRHRRRSR